MKTLSREAIIRMTDNGTGSGGVGGGGGGTDLAGYATESWVDENYLSKAFWNQIFTIHGTITTTVKDSGGEIISGPTTVTTTLSPNALPGTIETTDETTGNVTTIVTAITNIEAKKGLWTNFFLSALGQNSGGGGGTVLTEPLNSINSANLGLPSEAGQVITWNGSQWIYSIPSGGGGGGTGTVTSITAGTGLTTGGSAITTMGTIAINSTYQTYIGHGETAYGWGNHANAGYLTSVAFSDLTSHPATLAGYGITDAYTKAESDAKFMTIAAFENLFSALDSNGDPVSHPYASGVASIKAAFGLWTEQYLSALGLNSSGSGGGAIALGDLVNVDLNSPTNGQVLMYDAANNKWYNGTVSGGGGGTGTVTSIATGTGLTGGPITTSGTISIDSTYQTYIGHGETAYGWGNHANAGYLTSVAFSDLTSHPATLAGYGITDAYTKAESDAKFMTIAAFENLFSALDSNGDPVSHPYASGVASIKAAFGLWTEQYLSALGLNSSGSGGGAIALGDLVNVDLNSPTNGQVLMYDAANNKWYNGTVSGGGGGTGTVTSIATGTGLTGGPITTSGTISIDSTYQTYISHGETAYGWGNHANAGYATPSSVATQMQNYAYISSGTIHIGESSINTSNFLTSVAFSDLTSHPNTLSGYGITDALNDSTSFWGQTASYGVVSGSIEAGNDGGNIGGFHSIELNTHGSLSGYGGFIDFHFNGSSSDYTSRIIEDASGRLRLMADNGVRIGDCVLLWDSTAGALKVQRYDGTAAGFYATGSVSALGAQTGSSGSIAALTITESITFNDNSDGGEITTNGGPLTISTDNNSDWIMMDDVCSGDGQAYWSIQMDGKAFFANKCQSPKFYLDSTRYIYLDSGTLKYFDGTNSRTISLE